MSLWLSHESTTVRTLTSYSWRFRGIACLRYKYDFREFIQEKLNPYGFVARLIALFVETVLEGIPIKELSRRSLNTHNLFLLYLVVNNFFLW